MHVDSLVDGQEVVLDRKTNELLPRATVDALLPGRCTRCGVAMVKRQSGEYYCPKCGGTVAQPVESIPNPTLEIERAKRNIQRARGFGEESKLTVGDLSVVDEEKRKAVRQRLRALHDGLTVGDLSTATDAKLEEARLDDLFVGGKVEPCVSESEAVKAKMMEKHKRKLEEMQRLRRMLYE
jgi:uncharacterized Zn finger protein (UPF0148 family)